MLFSQSLVPGTTTPSQMAAFLLLLLSHPLVECARSPRDPSSLHKQEDSEDWQQKIREDHRHPGHLARRGRAWDGGEGAAVLDVSADVDQEPDARGEYTGASLTKPGMAPDFTICGAFRTQAWTTAFSGTRLFQLIGNDGKMWGYLGIFAAYTYTEYSGPLGRVTLRVTTEKVWFPLTWTHVCVSMDTVSGRVVMVVDGRVLDDGVHPEAKETDLR